MKKFKAYFSGFLAVLVVVFAIQNASTVNIQFLFWSFSSPRFFMILVLLAIGFVLGLLMPGFIGRRR